MDFLDFGELPPQTTPQPHHEKIFIFNCNICLYHTNIKTKYDRHIKTNKHKRNIEKDQNKTIKNFVCNLCKKKFKSKKYLENHKYSNIHTKIFCNLCNYFTNRKYNLLIHYEKKHQIKENEIQQKIKILYLENQEIKHKYINQEFSYFIF